MSRETVNDLCKTLPDAHVSDPWGGGHDAWKVGDKMFANIGSMGLGVAIKCATAQDAMHLEDMFGWPKAPYMHRSWVLLPLDLPRDELCQRIEGSYALIRAKLPAKVRAALAPYPPQS